MSGNIIARRQDGLVALSEAGDTKIITDIDTVEKIGALVKERHELGIRISQILRDRGLSASDDDETETFAG